MRSPEILQVTPSVWCVRRPEFLSCSYVVGRPNGAVLVDAGLDPTGGDMEAGLAVAGRTARDVKAILLTHWHNDHASGAPHFARVSGAEVLYHEAGAEKFLKAHPPSPWRTRLARRIPETGILAALRGLLEVGPPEPLQATRHVKDGDLIADDFRVIGTPGHAAGHLSYWFEPERVLFTGDALAVAGGRVSFMSRWLTDDLKAARSSMLRCLAFDAAAYCPGHRRPLVPVSPEERARASRRVFSARPWPLYGC